MLPLFKLFALPPLPLALFVFGIFEEPDFFTLFTITLDPDVLIFFNIRLTSPESPNKALVDLMLPPFPLLPDCFTLLRLSILSLFLLPPDLDDLNNFGILELLDPPFPFPLPETLVDDLLPEALIDLDVLVPPLVIVLSTRLTSPESPDKPLVPLILLLPPLLPDCFTLLRLLILPLIPLRPDLDDLNNLGILELLDPPFPFPLPETLVDDLLLEALIDLDSLNLRMTSPDTDHEDLTDLILPLPPLPFPDLIDSRDLILGTLDDLALRLFAFFIFAEPLAFTLLRDLELFQLPLPDD